jgi:hypothetical protein
LQNVSGQIIKAPKKLNSKRTNNPINKWANELNRQFSEVQMDDKYMHKYSTSLVIKEMQIKTTLRFCLTPVRLTIIKKTTTDAKAAGEKGTGILFNSCVCMPAFLLPMELYNLSSLNSSLRLLCRILDIFLIIISHYLLPNSASFHSFVESRSKIIMILIIMLEQECKKGIVGKLTNRERRKIGYLGSVLS